MKNVFFAEPWTIDMSPDRCGCLKGGVGRSASPCLRRLELRVVCAEFSGAAVVENHPRLLCSRAGGKLCCAGLALKSVQNCPIRTNEQPGCYVSTNPFRGGVQGELLKCLIGQRRRVGGIINLERADWLS